ncbi:MAG: hypothetical protein KDK03_18970 [Rhodobacteraceae bacterium]|nr:hypothetical protein [Paracoccaceae bacterium]
MSQARFLRLAAAAIAAHAGLSGLAAHAETPRSAIPWLSQSIEGGFDSATGTLPDALPLGPEPITVTPLGAPSRDAVGILTPETSGFRRDLWGPTTAAEAREAVLSARGTGVPAARALFLQLLLAEADPPDGSDPGSGLLVARIDRLLAMGALEQAEALILYVDPSDPALFLRWFDIGLLSDNAEPPCEALRRNPALSPTLPARVFCLARGGDWNAAEITLTMGDEVGSIPSEERDLLARFLDPELFEGEPDPPAPDPLTPLDFLMREAVGLPRPPGNLPLAFLYADLGEHTPMRTRISAAERLVISGAIGPAALFAAYRAGEPAASGGVWDRAAAVQALDEALASAEPGRIATALPAADAALRASGLRVALAQEYAAALAGLDPGAYHGAARGALFELLLLGGETEAAARFLPATPDVREAVVARLHDIALPQDAPGPDTDPLALAAVEAFASKPPPDHLERSLADKSAEGRQGEVILEALDLLADGSETAPPSLRAALRALAATGLETAARQIAAETLLTGPETGR